MGSKSLNTTPGGGERLALVAMLLSFILVLGVLGILAVSKDSVIKGEPGDNAPTRTVELRRERFDTRVLNGSPYPRNSGLKLPELEGQVPSE